ncbi:hypothetical protein ANRL4_00060 [Anaerolineae bacterium]|nr:hypothetical protein ANRL4_00060 [Anaerolineae bacterium]
MSAAIAALIAALAVVVKLSATTTRTEPIESLLNVLLNVFGNQSRMLSADEAGTVLLFSVVIYVVVFSVVFFSLRTLAMFFAAFGLPNEDQIRLNRDLQRGRGVYMSAMKRQSRFTALYTVRAQQAYLAAQRRKQARAQGGGSAIPEPTIKDFK